ncbi:Uncharacterised protein [Serratia entomophila]|nr:Uncharacterised protein [Serratia entomophila]CAI0729781.1 Uncharacterised protein [Serratia entomophila]CAI0731200.1 Uncharacterised protein [Serratia entomophila]CAI0745927.1 Uncharacterised protein [Serratia entomophila]CAI0761583.1 Uncharacterised protein [Serratia entomophila]
MEQIKKTENNAGNKIFLNINHSLDNFKKLLIFIIII